ncbi:MAG: hypothetical protein M0R22_10520 [Dehalococcoidia bacterium]|nr:hypothetical protein [Dehalococcoidia bacterium]
MNKNVKKIEITVPPELFSAVEEQSKARGESLSQFFCRGAETLLRRHKERRMLEQYVESRTKMPDPSEVAAAQRNLGTTTDE